MPEPSSSLLVGPSVSGPSAQIERLNEALDAIHGTALGGLGVDERGALEYIVQTVANVRGDADTGIADDSPCGRLLVGQGDDTYDPECVLPKGHGGRCQP